MQPHKTELGHTVLQTHRAALDLRHQELVLQIAVQQAGRGDAVVVMDADLQQPLTASPAPVRCRYSAEYRAAAQRR